MISIDQLLDALDSSREKLLITLESLPDEALLMKQAVDEWSISDVLNNITAWEAELVTGMMRLRQNKRPSRLLDALQDPKQYDELRHAENQDRDLDQVFLDLQQVRVQVEEWIAEFSERDLNNPQRYQWLGGKALQEIIARASYKREKNFVPHIQLFAQQWILFETEEDSTIPLTVFSLNTEDNFHEDTD